MKRRPAIVPTGAGVSGGLASHRLIRGLKGPYYHFRIEERLTKLRFRLTHKIIFSALAITPLTLGAFLFGFLSFRHLKGSIPNELREQYHLRGGNAPPSVRAGVIATLRDFQQGYVKRDAKDLNAFMNRLFLRNDDILLLGTGGGEWARGYPAATQFIGSDWMYWGDFRFAVDDSAIWSSGDVAWIASVGAVHEYGMARPLRFSAILTRNGSNWVLRQADFQWDDREPGPADLLRPSTHVKLLKWVWRYICDIA